MDEACWEALPEKRSDKLLAPKNVDIFRGVKSTNYLDSDKTNRKAL